MMMMGGGGSKKLYIQTPDRPHPAAVMLFEGVCLVHTNVILASLRVEVGSERVGATPFPRAEFD